MVLLLISSAQVGETQSSGVGTVQRVCIHADSKTRVAWPFLSEVCVSLRVPVDPMGNKLSLIVFDVDLFIC